MSSIIMQGESGSWITWVPIVLAGIGLNIWILLYLFVKWPGATDQPLPILGYVLGGISALILVVLM